MSANAAFVLVLLGVALLMFWREWLPVEVTSLCVVVALVLSGVLTPKEALAGFGSDTVILMAALFVICGGLLRTGLIDYLGRQIERFAKQSFQRVYLGILSAVGMVSAFVSNTTTTAVFLPVVLGIAQRRNVSPGKVLMPLAFASILGGTITLIGTSTNIAVSSNLPMYGMEPLTLFELAPVGLPIAIAGMIYLLTVARKLLPSASQATLSDTYHIRLYLSEAVISADSPLIGKTLTESNLAAEMDLEILGLIRDGKRRIADVAQETLGEGDILLVKGRLDDILKVKEATGIEIRPQVQFTDEQLLSAETGLAEGVVLPSSRYVGQRIADLRIRERDGIVILAIYRHGILLSQRLADVRLKQGDIVLIQGRQRQFQRLHGEETLLILQDKIAQTPVRLSRRGYAVLAFVVMLGLALSGYVDMTLAAIIGAVLMFLFRALTPEEAYNLVDWRILILIGGMTSFGLAMRASGAADFLAEGIVQFAAPLGPIGMLGGFFLLTAFLTQPMSNAAAALVVLPVAIQTATKLSLNPRAFAIIICVAASASFMTPLEPSCLLVYGPGRYRFSDFVKVGAGLTAIVMALTLTIVPIFWPL